VRKTSEGYEILIASALDNPSAEQRDLDESEWILDDGKKVKLVFGDYSMAMDTIAHHMEQAKKYAANDHEIEMMEQYSKSFRTGSLEAYKLSQKAWVQDKGPTVESGQQGAHTRIRQVGRDGAHLHPIVTLGQVV
jgi:dipeptidyl-peptidase-3